jgi:hypothetical protein
MNKIMIKMMRITFCWMVILTGLSAQQCKQDVNPEFLYQQWIHLHEEDAGGIEVYRNEEYNFPVSRGRKGFEFRKDGTFIQSDIGPVDVNVNIPGQWKKVADKQVRIQLKDEENTQYLMEIVDLKKDVLKIKRIASK